MSIVKKLPAVLIAAVGISFSFAGTALAGEIFAEKTLGPRDDLDIEPPNTSNTKICFKATDNLRPQLMIMGIADPRNPTIIYIPFDMKGKKITQESDHQCISMYVGYVGVVMNIGGDEESKSIHVYVRQE